APFAVESSVTLTPATLLLLGGSLAALGLSAERRFSPLEVGAGTGLAAAAAGPAGLGLLAGELVAERRNAARRLPWILLSGGLVLALAAPGVLRSFPHFPGPSLAVDAKSPLLDAIVTIARTAGPLVLVLAIAGKLSLLRSRRATTSAILLAAGATFLIPVVRHTTSAPVLAGTLPFVFLLAGTGAATGLLGRAVAGVALVIATFGTGQLLASGLVPGPRDAAADWARRHVGAYEVVLVEGEPLAVGTVAGAREADELVREGALTAERRDEYVGNGKVFQPRPLPAPATEGSEATLFYDPNVAQFFRWMILEVPPPLPEDRSPTPEERARTEFHRYFTETWNVVERFERGLSRSPELVAVARPEGFTDLDRDRLAPLNSILHGPETSACRDTSRAFARWILDTGIAFRQVNESIAARRFLDLAAQLEPDAFEPVYQRALVALQRDDPSGARDDLLTALSRDPTSGGAHYNFGTVLEAEGDYDGAVTEYLAAISFLDDPAPAHARLGRLLALAGRPDEARGQLEALRRLAPDSDEVHSLESLLSAP
ncbi:MAG: tetratricopeptide repeat protein, partial [Gemmatimonadetes bacterium]|nr:tetratricopeptide repeat protein [Gemmatimonadota bacterium]